MYTLEEIKDMVNHYQQLVDSVYEQGSGDCSNTEMYEVYLSDLQYWESLYFEYEKIEREQENYRLHILSKQQEEFNKKYLEV